MNTVESEFQVVLKRQNKLKSARNHIENAAIMLNRSKNPESLFTYAPEISNKLASALSFINDAMEVPCE